MPLETGRNPPVDFPGDVHEDIFQAVIKGVEHGGGGRNFHQVGLTLLDTLQQFSVSLEQPIDLLDLKNDSRPYFLNQFGQVFLSPLEI